MFLLFFTLKRQQCRADVLQVDFVIHNSCRYLFVTGFRQEQRIEFCIQFVSIHTAITVM
jgi:hypothetical protein